METAQFRLKIEAKPITLLMKAIAVVCTEANFKITKAGLDLIEMAPSRVAMVVVNQKPDNFEEYEVSQEGFLTIQINELLKILARVGAKEKVQLQTNLETGKLDIEISGKYHRVFNMPVLEPMTEQLPIPKVSMTSQLKIKSEGLREAFEDTAVVSDHVKIMTNKKAVHLKAVGDVMDADVKLTTKDQYTLDFFTQEEEAVAIFSVEYLTDMVKEGSNLSDIVIIEYAQDMPCRIQFGDLSYWLAPRISVED